MSAAILHIVATPIGNLDDITLRALRVLSEVKVIAAEDTRHTRRLLSHHGVSTPLVALHEHNEGQIAPALVSRLQQGESVALVSDAGTPLLSDPGYRLVSLAADNGIPVSPVPGASAITAALSVSGLPTDRFTFEGFAPSKSAARIRWLRNLERETRTLVVFESSHRIVASLADMVEVFGPERQGAVCRELTKQFETLLRGKLPELLEAVQQDPNQQKGEFVVVIGGAIRERDSGLDAAVQLGRELQAHLPASKAARIAAKVHDVSRRDVYEQLERDR